MQHVSLLSDALSLIIEAQRDALRGDKPNMHRVAASAAALLSTLPK